MWGGQKDHEGWQESATGVGNDPHAGETFEARVARAEIGRDRQQSWRGLIMQQI